MRNKFKNIYPLLLSSIFILTSCNIITKVETDDLDDDPVTFPVEDDRVSYFSPTRTRAAEEADTFVYPKKVVLHYHNDDKACLKRRFYTWVTGVDGLERKPDAATWTETDMTITLDFDVYTEYANMPSLMFIIKVAGTWAGQSEDIELSYEKYQPNSQGVTEVWCIPGEGSAIEIYKTEEETKFPKILTAKFTDFKTIHCEADEKPLYYKLYAYDKNYLIESEDEQIADKQFHLFKSDTPSGMTFDIKFNYTAKLNVQYVIESEYQSVPGKIQRIIVSCENLYSQPRFEKYYTYNDANSNDLGVTYIDNQNTMFKVWSPISAVAYVNIYNVGAPKSLGGSDACRSYAMTYNPGGVWSKHITGMDLKGKYYTYTFIHSNGEIETIDPYAKASGLNGVRGYIYDPSETNPEGWDDVPSVWDGEEGYDISSPQDLSIYEVHIRDLTMDSTWNSANLTNPTKRGTYDAFSEKGTRYTEDGVTVTTGFDHIEELGVNAIQLLPVFDSDNDEREDKYKFNWGYNPLNYNCVEGAYSSNPSDPIASIKEYKNLIMQYAKNANHTRTIMDVVYNHVSSASSSCFTKVMPKYYFRYTDNWEYYDGSGCNNEVKSDATMMRKYIVDSLLWWASEYKIKGFRFDLMGLIDTWTLKEAKQKLYALDKDIYIYGEGWTSGGYHGATEYNSSGELINGGASTYLVYRQLHDGVTPGYVGGFNDEGRNSLRGSNDDGYNGNPYPTWGFISQGAEHVGNKASKIASMMKGINDRDNEGGANPLNTVNYASCHDNYTLWDQLTYTLSENYASDHSPIGKAPSVLDRVNASLTSHAAIMMSNAASFIQGGEELYRTKSYDKNSEELKKLMDAGTVRPYPDKPHYSSDPEVEIATSEVRMFDRVVSHNSYKSSDTLNSFKWDRKIKVDGVDVTSYNKVWQDMVKAKRNLKHYKFEENEQEANINSWGVYDGSTVFATWLSSGTSGGGYYFVMSGREGGSIGILLSNTSVVFKVGTASYANGTLTLGKYSFVCYRVN